MADNRQDGGLNPVDIGIIGGGKGGTALLQALKDIPQVTIVGGNADVVYDDARKQIKLANIRP